jgi:phage-related holin
MDILNQFITLVDGVKLTTLAVLIAVDFIAGIVVAIKNGTFEFAKLAQFLNTSVLGYVGGYFLLGFAATVEESLVPVVVVAWGLLDATLLAGILGKCKQLGLPIPDSIANIISKLP